MSPMPITPRPDQANSEFAKLLAQSDPGNSLEPGALVKGKVVRLTDDFVVVDVGLKAEGQIPASEFTDAQGHLTVAVGDPVEVLLETFEDDEGLIVLSKERADAFKAWDSLVKIQEEDAIVEGVVVGKVKGGLSVDVGVKAFLPGSQIDIRPVRTLDKYLGKKMRFKILKLNKRRGNIVLSRKAVLEVERENIKDSVLKNLKEGLVLDGVVKNVTDYGAFIDLGGLDGLLHITDMSWGHVGHPSELFGVGDDVQVVVLKYDEATNRVSLGYKQLQSDPWTEVEGHFPVGSRVSGKVTNVTDYGAFVALTDGIEGLVHVSELTWSKKVKHPSQVVQIGETVEAIVLDIDLENRRISLGAKQLKANPWDTLEQNYPVGSKVAGTVRNITDFGVFVDVGVEIDGMVHVSDVAWTQTFGHPSELYKKGDPIEAVVLNIDRENERFSLGVKQLTPQGSQTQE